MGLARGCFFTHLALKPQIFAGARYARRVRQKPSLNQMA